MGFHTDTMYIQVKKRTDMQKQKSSQKFEFCEEMVETVKMDGRQQPEGCRRPSMDSPTA